MYFFLKKPKAVNLPARSFATGLAALSNTFICSLFEDHCSQRWYKIKWTYNDQHAQDHILFATERYFSQQVSK